MQVVLQNVAVRDNGRIWNYSPDCCPLVVDSLEYRYTDELTLDPDYVTNNHTYLKYQTPAMNIEAKVNFVPALVPRTWTLGFVQGMRSYGGIAAYPLGQLQT